MHDSSNRIVLTGGAGFIGSHVAEALLRRRSQLTIIDSLDDFYAPAWKKANLEAVRRLGECRFLQTDICDFESVRAALAAVKPDVIVHLAARAGIRPSIEQPRLYEQVNVSGTLNLLEICRQLGIPKFIFGSSSSVYGASNQIPFSEEQMEAIRKKVTMVFQNGALFDSLTVGENVAFPLREGRDLNEEQIYEIVDGLLRMVGVQEMRDLLPSDLSTGMKRSVAIARALAARPECVLYDEPTTMVDPLMAQLLGDLIKRLKIQLNLTSIVVTHDMRLAKKLAERVVFLHEGRAIFFGPYAEMEKSSEPIIREFLELDELKLEA